MLGNSFKRSEAGSSHSLGRPLEGSEAEPDLLRDKTSPSSQSHPLDQTRSSVMLDNGPPSPQRRSFERGVAESDFLRNQASSSRAFNQPQSLRRAKSLDLKQRDAHADPAILLQKRVRERHRGGPPIEQVDFEAHDVETHNTSDIIGGLKREKENVEKELEDLKAEFEPKSLLEKFAKNVDFRPGSARQQRYERLTITHRTLEKQIADLERPLENWRSFGRRVGVVTLTSVAIAAFNNIYPSVVGHEWKWGGWVGGSLAAGIATPVAAYATQRFFGGNFIPGGALLQAAIGTGTVITADQAWNAAANAIATHQNATQMANHVVNHVAHYMANSTAGIG
jgi:hypothetical protein